MAQPTLTEEIITIVNSVANNNPAPTQCTITKTYDNNYADAETDIGTYEYIKTIGTPTINTTGVIIYPDGDTDQPIIITDYTPPTNKWVKTELNDYADLWINTTLRLCKLRYTRTFNSATSDTFYTWHKAKIPTTYRPTHQSQGSFNHVGTLIVNTDGDIIGKFANSWNSERTVIGEVWWWY